MQLTGKFKFKTFYVEICFFSTLEVSNFAVFFRSMFTGMFWRNSNSQAGTMWIQGCRISTIYDGRYNNEYPLMWLKGCLCRGHVTEICKVILFIGLLWFEFLTKKALFVRTFSFRFCPWCLSRYTGKPSLWIYTCKRNSEHAQGLCLQLIVPFFVWNCQPNRQPRFNVRCHWKAIW